MAIDLSKIRPRSRPPRPTRLLRRLAPALSVGAAAGLTLTLTLTSTAGARSRPALHEDADHAGSTIRAHEGGQTADTMTTLAISGVKGMDVSGWQGNVNWRAAWYNGGRFAYIKATEGTRYTNPYFAQQYIGSYNIGMIRGAYHFARPNISSGATQADFFVNHGGKWSADGKTLPPMLDIEYNPYGSTCYGLSQRGMVSWLWSFFNRVLARTGRYMTIYTTTNWWQTCTGNYAGFSAYSPLFIARYASSIGTLPAGWGFHTMWQYSDSGVLPGDQDVFNGSYNRLFALAKG